MLIPISQVTARVNGGRLKVMGSLVRRTATPRASILIAPQGKKSILGQPAKTGMPLVRTGRGGREGRATRGIGPGLFGALTFNSGGLTVAATSAAGVLGGGADFWFFAATSAPGWFSSTTSETITRRFSGSSLVRASPALGNTFRIAPGLVYRLGHARRVPWRPFPERSAGLPFRCGHHRQTAMPGLVAGPHGKDDIILRHLHGCARHIPQLLRVLPLRTGGRSPQHFIRGRQPSG